MINNTLIILQMSIKIFVGKIRVKSGSLAGTSSRVKSFSNGSPHVYDVSVITYKYKNPPMFIVHFIILNNKQIFYNYSVKIRE